MTVYFLIHALTGVITFISVATFGSYGFAAGLLILLSLFFKKKSPLDEREYQLFYKSSDITLCVTFMACFMLHLFGHHFSFMGYSLNELTSPLLLCLILVVNGTSNAYLFAKG